MSSIFFKRFTKNLPSRLIAQQPPRLRYLYLRPGLNQLRLLRQPSLKVREAHPRRGISVLRHGDRHTHQERMLL